MRTRRTTNTVATALALAVAAPLLAPRFSRAQSAGSATPPSGSSAAPGAGANATPLASAPVQAPTLAVEQYTLANGLQVILHEDHRTPTVAVNIWYHVGSKDEPEGRNGFAHLFEHLMFQGSRHVPEDTFFRFLERSGATNVNGTTSTERTNYFEMVPAGRLNLALWLESDRMAFLLDHVDQATFESQRQVVLNERRQSYENAPYGNVVRFLHEAAYPHEHPYYRLAIGTPEDLGAATLDDVRQFFRTWYLPNNATMVLAGDFQPAAARAMVEQYFGPIARGPAVPRRPPPPAVALPHEARFEVEAGVALPRVYLAWHTPSYGAPGDAELDMVATVLTEGRSSRLYHRLVHELQIAQDVSAAQWSRALGSLFIVTVTARPGHTPEEVLRVVDEELARLRQTPPEAAEVARARTHFEADTVFDTEHLTSRADRFNFYNQYLGDPTFLPRDLARYQRVTPEDVQHAAQSFLPADRRVVGLVYADPSAPVSGRLRGAGGGAQQPAAPAAGGRQ